MPILKNITKAAVLAVTSGAIAATLSTAAQAFTFTLTESTKVKFDFLESNGAYKSNLNLFSQNKVFLETLFSEVQPFDYPRQGDAHGTCGETVLVCSVTRVLDAGSYKLGLQTGSKVSYKADDDGDLYAGLLLGFEDGKDNDYNDFVITAKAVTPEPSLLIGAGLAASSLMASRRRKADA